MRLSQYLSCIFLISFAFTTINFPCYAEDTRLIVAEQNALQKSLEKVIGQSVTLKLTSGQEVAGIVAKVGTEAVQLTQLQGKEFFDALVPIQNIEALIVRAKS